MNGKQTCFGIMISLFIILHSTSAIYGEQTGKTTVSYVPVATFHEMQVVVIGNGCYKDGNVDICTGKQVYQLKLEDIKIFTLYPEEGYQIKSVLYDGVSVEVFDTNQIQVGMKEYNTTLIITFEEIISEELIPKPIQPPVVPMEPPLYLRRDRKRNRRSGYQARKY